jgi:hypothetical protein
MRPWHRLRPGLMRISLGLTCPGGGDSSERVLGI